MKLWLLTAGQGLPEGNDPWEPWYDKAFGFVISAETEEEARKIAHEEAGDENRGSFLGNKTANTQAPWLDSKYSDCEELKPSMKPQVILRDFHAA